MLSGLQTEIDTHPAAYGVEHPTKTVRYVDKKQQVDRRK